VGTGFSDAERENPPAVGSLITFRYQELSDGGVPRFPSYVGVREEAKQPSTRGKADLIANAPTAPATRRFEFSDGTANKFWEITVRGLEVAVRFGRIGTQGQSNVKSFPDEAAAAKHAAKLIQEKQSKGYQEVA
jgi:DNA ligase-1